MKLSEVKIGHSFVSPRHGKGLLIETFKLTTTTDSKLSYTPCYTQYGLLR